jgi:cell division transport system permease protein
MNETVAQDAYQPDEPSKLVDTPARRSAEPPIVPKSTIAGRALVVVVAIMTFLSSLTTGAVVMVYAAAGDWQSEVAREATIQVRPEPGRDVEADVSRAAAIARGVSGVADVQPYSKQQSMRLLEPWLGSGLALDDLPVPRMIVVRFAPAAHVDLARLRSALTSAVPSATLDDHRGFVGRMQGMAQAAVFTGLGVLALVLVATVLSVTFATNGAMATNRPIVEVLHFIGAKDGFIARHIQQHFLVLGLKGGLIGGSCALLLFGVMGLLDRWFAGTPAGEEFRALFGTYSIGLPGYLLICAQIVLIALVTALASRLTVQRTLASINQ